MSNILRKTMHLTAVPLRNPQLLSTTWHQICICAMLNVDLQWLRENIGRLFHSFVQTCNIFFAWITVLTLKPAMNTAWTTTHGASCGICWTAAQRQITSVKRKWQEGLQRRLILTWHLCWTKHVQPNLRTDVYTGFYFFILSTEEGQ